jgi:uncharacterized protein (DUF1697 family)
MTTFVALLRGINVGGRKQVAMADLRGALTRWDFGDVRSLRQRGNLGFRSAERSGTPLERLLETEIRQRLALQTEIFVGSSMEWDEVSAGNPFPEEADRDPGRLVMMFLRNRPAAARVEVLRGAIRGREIVLTGGRQAYILYPDSIGRSRLTSALTETQPGTRGTGRNWNTVLKLGSLTGA